MQRHLNLLYDSNGTCSSCSKSKGRYVHPKIRRTKFRLESNQHPTDHITLILSHDASVGGLLADIKNNKSFSKRVTVLVATGLR